MHVDGLQGAAALRADCGKIVIAVSDDIDPTNPDAVFWSLAYRTNLNEDLHVAPNRAATARAASTTSAARPLNTSPR